MTLRRKALVIVGGVTLFLVTTLAIVGYTALANGFRATEESYTRKDVQRALAALSSNFIDIQTTVTDWAAWDDAYAFIQNANQDYIQANLSDNTFITLRLNLMVYINSSGQIAFAKAFDLNSGKEQPLPPGLEEHLAGQSPLLTSRDDNLPRTGILSLPEVPMIIGSHPILTSKGEGPSRGTLIIGRNLDSSMIEQLSQQTQSSLSIIRPTSTQLATDFAGLLAVGNQGATILVRPQNNQLVAGYSLLNDIYGQPALILKVEAPRDIYQQGRTVILYFSLMVALVGLGAFLAVFWLLDRQILLRLGKIIANIRDIGVHSSFSERVEIDGKDELVTLAVTTNMMLTQFEQVRREIIESEKKYRSLVENIRLGIFRSTPELPGRFLEVNKAMEEITGYTREELLQMNVSDFYVRPEDRQTLIDEISSGQEKMVHELNFRKKDGTTITVADTKAIVRDSTGKILYFDGILEDISERKRAEVEMHQLYEQEKLLRQALEKEMDRKTEFTRALVHELRTPLTAVLASSDLLTQELKQGPVSRLAKNVYEGATNLNCRIEELLDLARGEVNMLSMRLSPIDPLKVIRDVFTQTSALASAKNQSLLAELPPFLPTIYADEDRIRQVLANLMDNAIKFTPEGGKITICSRQEGEGIAVEVSDTGPGIDENDQKNLFEPYFRSPRDRERLKGLGLGLVLSKFFVEAHNGRIWFRSEKGKGSTFSFFLPIDPSKKRQGYENSAH